MANQKYELYITPELRDFLYKQGQPKDIAKFLELIREIFGDNPKSIKKASLVLTTHDKLVLVSKMLIGDEK